MHAGSVTHETLARTPQKMTTRQQLQNYMQLLADAAVQEIPVHVHEEEAEEPVETPGKMLSSLQQLSAKKNDASSSENPLEELEEGLYFLKEKDGEEPSADEDPSSESTLPSADEDPASGCCSVCRFMFWPACIEPSELRNTTIPLVDSCLPHHHPHLPRLPYHLYHPHILLA